MERQDKGFGLLPISAVVVLLGFGGFLLYDRPFESVRPEQPPPYSRPHPSSEGIDARLWEDPFKPVFAHRAPSVCASTETAPPRAAEATENRTAHELRHLAFEVRNELEGLRADSKTSNGKIALLPVMVPGEPYAEQAERRRRMRYAVLAGLGARGFVPVFADLIGYVEVCWSADGSIVQEEGRSVRLPFEWLERDRLLSPSENGVEVERVLVLWLDETEFRQEPFARLEDLLGHLVRYCYPNELGLDCLDQEDLQDRFQLRLLGPATSGGLQAMLAAPKARSRPVTTSTEPRQPEDRAAKLGSELCFHTFQPAVRTSPLFLFPEEPQRVDPSATALVRLCAPLKKEGTEDLAKAFELILIEKWKEVKSGKSPPPDYWSGWTEGLVTALQEKAGASYKADDDLHPLRLSPEAVDARIEAWVLANRAQLQGQVQKMDGVLKLLEVYSSRATAAPSLLLPGATGDAHRVAEEITDLHGIGAFLSTTASDDRLAEVLIDELRVRMKDLLGKKDLCRPDSNQTVALVGEWDTLYSRALGAAFEQELEGCRRERWCRGQGLEGVECEEAYTERSPRALESNPSVLRFHYLRGLDGSLPANRRVSDTSEGDVLSRPGTGADGGAESKYRESLGWTARERLERAIGPRQYDYMRRLAYQLSERERDLARHGRELSAIGVVGSDVYDKLLVLQALRKRFSRTLFFTTDLDARLSHPKEYGWNRNLLVASGYGLSLGEALQGAVPPFRDTYQAATFLAVQLALLDREGWAAQACDPKLVEGGAEPLSAVAALQEVRRCLEESELAGGAGPLHPRMFELGRSGPFDITRRGDEDPRTEALGLAPPRRVLRLNPWKIFGAAVVALVGLVLLLPLAPPLKRAVDSRWRSDEELAADGEPAGRPDPGGEARRGRRKLRLHDGDWVIILTLVTAALFVEIAYINASFNEYGEPFELWEGISLWPTEGLRLVALLLSVSFLVWGWKRLDSSDARIARRFGLSSPGEIRRDARSPEEEDGAGVGSSGPWSRGREELVGARRRSISISEWRRGEDPTEEGASRIAIAELWKEYLLLGRLRNRMVRSVPLGVFYLAFGVLLVVLFGSPHLPHRGPTSWWVDRSVLVLSVLAMTLLTFFVVDAIRLSKRFVDHLGSRTTDWSGARGGPLASERQTLQPDDRSDSLDAELIAEHTEAVGRLILYPFVVLLVMVVSRSGFFDNWDWPLSLVLIFGTAAGIALLCAITLRRTAEEARRLILHRLRMRAYEVAGRGGGGQEDGLAGAEREGARLEQLRMLVADVEALDHGAFSPWTRHPIAKAVLLPFGGIGALALLELLSTLGL